MRTDTRQTERSAAGSQLLPLIRLRWAMVRSAKTRRLLMLAATVPLLLCVLAVAIGRLLPRTGDVSGLLIIAPSLLLGFLVLSIITPLAAGGGTELYPQEQLVGFPIRARSIAMAALVLAPLNLAWLLQVLISLGLVSYASRTSTTATVAAAATILSFVLMVTAFGQALGWIVVGVRQTDAGRISTWALIGLAGGGFLVALQTGKLTSILDQSPTLWVLSASLRPAFGDYGTWAARTLLMLGFTAVFVMISSWTCGWALRQPDRRRGLNLRGRGRSATSAFDFSVADHHSWDGPPLRRHIERAGVWRSAPLRRGVLILSLLPAIALLITGSEASLVILLPGLVAAGSGLLFAVNAFCLDGSGATWLASLPGDPRDWFWGRTRLVAEVAAVSVIPLVVIGLLRLPQSAGITLTITVVAAGLSSVGWVTALCLRASVVRPHAATMAGPRDTPAPPGAMAVHSIRLSAACTGIGLLFLLADLSGEWWSPTSMGIGLVALAWRSLRQTAKLWQDDAIRARVVAIVGSG